MKNTTINSCLLAIALASLFSACGQGPTLAPAQDSTAGAASASPRAVTEYRTIYLALDFERGDTLNNGLDKFDGLVNARIKKGWHPVGGITISRVSDTANLAGGGGMSTVTNAVHIAQAIAR